MMLKTIAPLLVLLSSLAQPTGASATDYPDRPIKIVVSTTPGSAVDVIARVFSTPLSDALKQPIVIENKGGANGQIAATQVANAEPDGYTFLVTTAATLSTNPFLFPETGNVVISGLDPVTVLVSNDFVIAARATLGVRSFPEFIEWMRKNPGKLNLATSVRGGALNLAGELLKQMTQLNFTIVPHNGGGLAVNSVLGEHTDALIETTTLTQPQVESGKLVALATTGDKRSQFAPGIPTVSEVGYPNYKVSGWIAMVAPKGTPREVVDRVHAELSKIAARPETQQTLIRSQVSSVINTPDEFRAQWQKELALWKDVIAASGIQADK